VWGPATETAKVEHTRRVPQTHQESSRSGTLKWRWSAIG
jgi:hypothetical protein